MNPVTSTDPIMAGFGDQKKKLIWHLKTHGETSLTDLASTLNISKMAVHKHLVTLEQRGLVENRAVKKGVGRPALAYKLTSGSQNLFPKSYSAIATCALEFIEKKLGREAIEQVLRQRQNELLEKYRDPLRKHEFEERVKELAKIRDREGYMAESKKLSPNKYLLFEHNCPLIHVADKYWEACTTETELFEKLLGAKVEATHRVAGGDAVCRFLIQKRRD